MRQGRQKIGSGKAGAFSFSRIHVGCLPVSNTETVNKVKDVLVCI